MLKLWNLKTKIANVRGTIQTTGIEEAEHEIIVWKHWVGFYPQTDFLHHVILRQNLYTFMDILLKTGTYSVCMKRDDGTNLYSANIIGISPYMLEPLTGLEYHSILTKMRDLEDLGYISFTEPTKGRSQMMNILLNEYTKSGLRVFQIEDKTWLNERISVEKVSLIAELEDIRYVGEFNGVGGINGENIPGNHPIQKLSTSNLQVEGLPTNNNNGSEQQSSLQVEGLPTNGGGGSGGKGNLQVEGLPANKGGGDMSQVESLPTTSVNVINDLTEDDSDGEMFLTDPSGFEGVGKELIATIQSMAGKKFRGRGG